MSRFVDSLNAQRVRLGLEVKDVAAELNRRGFVLAYSTVAGWFNGSRGERWKMNELKALCSVLQTSVDAMLGGEVELVEDPLGAAVAREIKALPPAQQQAILAMIVSMKERG